MAEVKNAFIKSKMNKDLDSRLIPSGEYRNATNIQVSKSEGSDVGSLENTLGNELVSDFGLNINNLSSIGYYSDEVNGVIYVFLTDNETNSYSPSGIGSNHYIISYNTSDNNYNILVTGAFLNFSKLNRIFGVNLIEDLLFWTDNRNQPRKINVKSATQPGYYSTEDNISVAKYNPYQSIELYEASSLSPGDYESTMKDVSSIAYPDGGTSEVNGTQTGTTITIINTNIPIGGVPKAGQNVKKIDVLGNVVDLGVTVSTTPESTSTTLHVSGSIDVQNEDVLVFNANPYYIPNYKGDPKFLEDKFVRFSYRFKFDDGEYSIMAPFTQPCFIPKQDGYFLNNSSTEGDEEQAFSSTIVDFMENKVNKIDLKIPLPSSVQNLKNDLHIKEIDILYKESDSVAVQVVETIYSNNNFGIDPADSLLDTITYSYESQIPYKTLTSDETTRVYDKVPVKALSQEIISNRIVYGNYQDKHTPPSSLDYNVIFSPKASFDLRTGSATFTGTSGSYPSGTPIDVSNYLGTIQAGSLASSSNQSDIIPLNTLVLETNGSTSITLNKDVQLTQSTTIQFNPVGADENTTSIIEYPSSGLKTNRNYQVAFVLSDKFGRQSSAILSTNEQTASTFSVSTVFAPYIDKNIDPFDWIGSSLKITVNSPIGTEEGDSNTSNPGIYNGEITSVDYNPLGWYSYKIVVKQTEQEYYNVYSAGAMKGLPYNYVSNNVSPVLNEKTSFITLLNDNINKIPRDLSEVGPQDKTFRSSVQLFGRVENNSTTNEQFYPGKKSFTTSSIEDLFGLFEVEEFKGIFNEAIPITSPLNAFYGFFKSDSDPFIAEISTSQDPNFQFGVNNSYTSTPGSGQANASGTDVLEVVLTGNTITGSISVGSVLVSIDGLEITDTFIVNKTSETNPTITLNNKISFNQGDDFIFSQQNFNNINTLAVFETKPVISRLDIFWETSSSGLITDLNNFVLNSTSAGSGFSNWNDEPFAENNTVGTNILNNDFILVDNLNNPITIGPLDTFNLNSVLDNQSPTPLDVTNWFELYEVSNSIYNVRVTQDFVDNAYYGSTVGSNNFNFSFTSVIDGVITNYNQTASLSNVNPIMSGPDNGGTTPTPSVDYNAIISTQPSFIGTFTAVNGANLAGNQGKDIVWSITANKDGVDYGSSFGVSYTNTNTLSTCVLSNINPSGIPGGIYTLQLKCIDAGGAFQEITILAQAGVIPTRVTEQYFKYNAGNPENEFIRTDVVCLIPVNNDPDPANTNGWYLRVGNWNYVKSVAVNNTIYLKQSNDTQQPVNYFYNQTKLEVLEDWRQTFTNDFPQSYSADEGTTSSAVNNDFDIPLNNLNGRLQLGLRVSGQGITPGTTITAVNQAGDNNDVGIITVSSRQTLASGVEIRIGDVPSSEVENYAFELIT